ncbi:MAG TPA: hypothetical protein VFS54_08920 [Solirubrobacterales bacterium]|nr:hypothetical protein [Solirubrobacterales bacterium]
MAWVEGADFSHEETLDFREFDLIQAIAQRIAGHDLSLDIQPAIGPVRPDFIVRRNQHPLMVVEVKREQGSVHFAGLSQAAAYGKVLEQVSNRHVQPVLASTGGVSEGILALAATLGVQVISLHGLDLDRAAKHFVDRLTTLAETLEHQEISGVQAESADQSFAVLHNLLVHGQTQPQIADRLRVDQDELVKLYMGLLTQLEATDPDQLDPVMRAWESAVLGR